jgi:hypothetical protein
MPCASLRAFSSRFRRVSLLRVNFFDFLFMAGSFCNSVPVSDPAAQSYLTPLAMLQTI